MKCPKARMRHATKHRLGFAGYCRILSSIMSHPGTGIELAERLKVDGNGLNHILRSLHRMKLIHRPEWVRPKPHSVLIPVWHGGSGGDVEPMVNAKRYTCRPARGQAVMLGTIAEVLAEGPMSMNDLAEEVGRHRETMIRLVRIMREHGLIRIAEWQQNGGNPVPLYVYGRGPNKKKPKPMTDDPATARKHAATHYAKKKHIKTLHALAGVPRSIFEVAA